MSKLLKLVQIGKRELQLSDEAYRDLLEGLLQRRIATGKARLCPELGLEKWCPHCREFWPQDTLFWTPSNSERDDLQSWCKACQLEYKNSRKAA